MSKNSTNPIERLQTCGILYGLKPTQDKIMTHENGTTARRLLKRSDAMDEKLYAFAKQGLTMVAVAAELGCHKDTLRNFFEREPEARALYMKGKSEAREVGNEKRRVAARAYQAQGTMREVQGQTCPTCGQAYQAFSDQEITISGAVLADARRKLEELFDRYDAADKAAEAQARKM